MATAVVSGRVDEGVRDRANAHIHAAGLTVGDVVKTVWENIAQTGEVPSPAAQGTASDGQDPVDALYALREELSGAAGDAGWLGDLEKERLCDEVAESLMEKYGYA